MTRVLLAEDDTSISEPLSRALRREGYQVEVTEDGPTTLGRALSDGIDLILLDIGLPELDGLEVCRRVRAEGSGVPVLILTARADEVDTVVGLDAGADDYVTKPFGPREFLARMQVALRRAARGGAQEAALTIGPWRIDLTARLARDPEGQLLHLTPIEFDLLLSLARRPGQVVSRQALLAEVWDWADASGTRTVDSHVKALRKKIGAERIRTVHGVGYSLETGLEADAP